MKKETNIGLGTAAIGRPQYINIRTRPQNPRISLSDFRQEGTAVLDAAYEQGVRYFDTAPGYGMAEEMLGEWAHAKNDPHIEIATKWGYTYVANFDPAATQHEVKEHSLEKLEEQWAHSQKLRPYLSTYQIHSATLETGVLDNEAVLNRLAAYKAEGLRMGITTTGANQRAVLEKALDIHIGGADLFDVFQVTYNVFDQNLAEIAQHIQAAGKRLVIKEALANGRVFPTEKYPHYQEAYQKLTRLAESYEVGVDAIALRFCIDSLQPFKVLSGASQVAHMAANLQALSFSLSSSEISALESCAVHPPTYWNERKALAWN